MIELLPHGTTGIYNDELYSNNIEGSNCYSYAFNHFASNGKRPHKSVPGFITTFVTGIEYPDTDWQNCRKDIIERVLDDGETVSKLYKLNTNPITLTEGKNTNKQLMKKPLNGCRRVVMVIAPKGERKGTPTDFHFYAQRVIMLRDMYNIKLKRYTTSEVSQYVNPYIVADIHPFTTNLQLQRMYQDGNAKCISLINTSDSHTKRAIANIKLHAHIMPKYMIQYVPFPYWILDIQAHEIRNEKKIKEIIKKKVSDILKTVREPIMVSIIQTAMHLALKNKSHRDKTTTIGIWKHKLGWGTVPLNTDGDGKLIFDPSKANKNHGGYNYQTICGVFDVLVGYGMTSPWHDQVVMSKKYLKKKNG